MAKIAFFTERLPPDTDPIAGFSFELIRSLADQQHEIRVFSTYREGAELPAKHPRIEILRPFRRWSWLELPRLLPLLLDFQPDVLHMIQPRNEAFGGLANAMTAIPGFGPLIGRPVIVSSFYDLRSENMKAHRWLLMSSDAITVSNDPQLKLIGQYAMGLGRTPHVSILPVPATALLNAAVEPSWPEALMNFSAADWIFVPGDVSEHRDIEQLFKEFAIVLRELPDLAIVFGGGWGRIPRRQRHALMRIFGDNGARVLLTGPLAIEQERMCLSRARLTFTASLPAESLQLARILREALEVTAPLVLSEDQSIIDSLSWRHGENALVAGSNSGDWSKALIDSLRSPEVIESIRSRLPEFTRAEAVDQPGNVMSRIYAHILQSRRASSGAQPQV